MSNLHLDHGYLLQVHLGRSKGVQYSHQEVCTENQHRSQLQFICLRNDFSGASIAIKTCFSPHLLGLNPNNAVIKWEGPSQLLVPLQAIDCVDSTSYACLYFIYTSLYPSNTKLVNIDQVIGRVGNSNPNPIRYTVEERRWSQHASVHMISSSTRERSYLLTSCLDIGHCSSHNFRCFISFFHQSYCCLSMILFGLNFVSVK